MIGVTGTDGKTTTCTLIYELLKAAGYRVGLLSTVSAKYIDSFEKEIEIETGLHTTNPGPEELQPILKKMVIEGVTHMVMEVTSHGLDQNRVWGCDFKIGVLTNISHEHLDYHKNMQNYINAKLKLFRTVKYAVLNVDEPTFAYFKSEILNPKFQINSNIQIIKYSKANIKNISLVLEGEYNLYNIAAATEVARILNIHSSIINKVIREFRGVPGRREEVKAEQKFRVFVDFAHTPNALEKILQAMQALKTRKAKIIVVFGATGERDKDKRPIMGKVAAKRADVVIITSDDTRMEKQDEIAKQILSGIEIKSQNSKCKISTQNSKIFLQNDRRKAIELAVKLAKPGDIVLLAGKGHEKSILHGTTEYPWSDAEEAVRAIKMSRR